MIDARRHGQDGHDSEDDGGAHGHERSVPCSAPVTRRGSIDVVTPYAVQVADVAADFSGPAVVVVVAEHAHFGGAHAEVASAIVDVLVEARARLGPALAPHDCADAIPATPSHTTPKRKTTRPSHVLIVNP